MRHGIGELVRPKGGFAGDGLLLGGRK